MHIQVNKTHTHVIGEGTRLTLGFLTSSLPESFILVINPFLMNCCRIIDSVHCAETQARQMSGRFCVNYYLSYTDVNFIYLYFI